MRGCIDAGMFDGDGDLIEEAERGGLLVALIRDIEIPDRAWVFGRVSLLVDGSGEQAEAGLMTVAGGRGEPEITGIEVEQQINFGRPRAILSEQRGEMEPDGRVGEWREQGPSQAVLG